MSKSFGNTAILEKSLAGAKEANTDWLVIQHSLLAIQQKYFLLLKQATKKGEMEKFNLALLIDRIRLFKGQKQLYGSQVQVDSTGKWFFPPIEDESNVNKRRSKVDMEPIEEYAKEINVRYKPRQK